jgi:hypothetical protein
VVTPTGLDRLTTTTPREISEIEGIMKARK